MSDLLDRLRSLGIEYEQGPYGQPLLRLPGSRQFVAPTGVVKPLAGVEQSAMQRLEEMSAGWVQGIKSETPLTPEERYAQAEPAIRASLRQEPRWAENWQQAYPQQLQARRASTYAVSTEEGEYISPWDLRSQFGTEGRFFRPGGGSDERDVAGKMTGRREPLRAIDVGTIATIPGVV
ncbi:MAG: hypothetical protein M0R06_22665, partial [Sphaerochaeta sp.]|nr:hypothetical protein [Sphaerochaeta sp.]